MTFLAGAKINKGDFLEVGKDGLLYPINYNPLEAAAEFAENLKTAIDKNTGGIRTKLQDLQENGRIEIKS